MEKKCFIILPASEPDGYAKGHFGRVYQYILMPACRQAGFNPVRAGDPDMDDSPLSIINTLIESDLVLCDLSSNFTHALYGFAVRQATSLPVVLIKDLKTTLHSNIPEYDLMEYDDSLRIDTVQTEVETLSEALKKTFANAPAPHELLSRLNVKSPQIEETTPLPVFTYNEDASPSTSAQEDEEEKAPSLPVISPLPDYVGDPLTQSQIDRLKVGDFFFHMNYGKGEIVTINHKTKDILAKVKFESGAKLLVLTPIDIFRKIIK